MDPHRLEVLDLFAGIGGFSLGLERTGGFRTVAFCEINRYCRRVLAKHWPGVPCYGDIRELDATRLARDNIRPAVITGGFPCQDVSLVGKHAGMAGEHFALWFEMARIVRTIRPRFVVVENVTALLARGLDRVLGDLAALGYGAEWHCIPACAVGALHRRDRVWIVADAECERLERLEPTGAAPPATDRSRDGRDSDWWRVEPDLCRVAHGIPARVDRLRALGNAIVPQVAELIGRAILTRIEKRPGEVPGREVEGVSWRADSKSGAV